MGILTTQESARSFSSYVTVISPLFPLMHKIKQNLLQKAFGLALLISSIIYLKRLDNSTELLSCEHDSLAETAAALVPDYPTCSQIHSWRVAAIIGIVIVN